MSARPESDGGLGYLQQKLGLFVQGPSQFRRNTALDILTGRVADERVPAPVPPTRTHASIAHRNVRALHATGDVARDVQWAGLRIEHPALPPAAGRTLVRPLVLASVLAGVALIAGFGLRGFLEYVAVVSPAPVLVDAAPEAVAPITAVVAITAAATNDTAFSALESANSSQPTLSPSPSVPVPASVLAVLLDERFSSNARGWPNDPQATAWLAGGTYRLAARKATQFVAVGIPGTQGLGDNVVTGTFRKVGGPPGGGYGLILRDQNPELRDGQNQCGHYYVFEAGDRGEVGVWLRDGDRWIDLLTWTASDAVKPGIAANELTVTAAGDHLSFVVNGIPVASQTDTVLRTGAAGVFVGGDGNDVALDRIAVSSTR